MSLARRARGPSRARRPVFVPASEGKELVREVELVFEWFPGFSIEQQQRSIAAMHLAAQEAAVSPVLEISSRSPSALGAALSAFRLRIRLPNGATTSVESAYQGSKIFRDAGGPWPEVYRLPSAEAKAFSRSHEKDSIRGFDFFGEPWPLTPMTAFYDWLYVTALSQDSSLEAKLSEFMGFSDIAFNPARSVACQARSAAMFVALAKRRALPGALRSREAFLGAVSGASEAAEPRHSSGQQSLI